MEVFSLHSVAMTTTSNRLLQNVRMQKMTMGGAAAAEQNKKTSHTHQGTEAWERPLQTSLGTTRWVG